jgi:hypothetical protein
MPQETMTVPRKWTPERVIQAIQDSHRQGVPVGKIWKDRTLCMAGISRFGSWRQALAAAGLRSARQQWSKERVIRELQERHSRSVSRCGRSKMDSRLAAAAERYFGSRHDALVAAGLPNGKRKVCRAWTRQQVIDAIRTRQQQGLPLSATWREDGMLYAVAKRTFDNWRRALEAAGYPLQPPRIWTREQVLQEIHARRDQGLPLEGIWRDRPGLYAAAKKRFGSGRNALLAAGLQLRPLRRWSRQAVLDAIRDRRERGLSRAWRDDKPLFRAAVRRFGNWEKAKVAAGLNPKPRRKWSEDRILEELTAWDLSSTCDLQAADPALAGAASRLFGSLDKALDAAGVEPKNRRWTARRVIVSIQDHYVRRLPIHINGFGDNRLAAAAKRRFGSWAAAVAAAGLVDKLPARVPTRNWTKAAVLDGIRAWHAQGRPISNVSKQDQGLYCTAKKHFGTWRGAVIAAGLEPTRKQWSRDRVLAEIRQRHARGGGMNTTAVFREDPPLAGAGTRLFGTWRAAVAAAGIRQRKARHRTRNTA